MEEDDYIPKMGIDFLKWSDLDDRLFKLDLNVELIIRHNVSIASYVILAGILKGDRQQRQRYLAILTPNHFDTQSLAKYLFTKITSYLEKNETVPVSVLESWIPQYSAEVWNQSPPNERMYFQYQMDIRRIINLTPTEDQVNKAIELRKDKMERYGC